MCSTYKRHEPVIGLGEISRDLHAGEQCGGIQRYGKTIDWIHQLMSRKPSRDHG